MSTSWKQLNDRLISQAKSKGVPISGQFELTARCNLTCKMCYVCLPASNMEIMARERSAKEWIHLAEEARNEGMLYLLLTGGEVFLRRDFREIYEGISRMGLRVGIYTNATLITPDMAKWIARIPPSRVEVTLYGASPETYAKVCGNAEGYERAVRGIDLLLSEGVNLELRTTLIRDNSSELNQIAEFAERRGAIFKTVGYISPRRDKCGTPNDSSRLSPDELVHYENLATLIYSARMAKERAQWPPVEENPTKDLTLHYDDHPFKCHAGRSEFWVTWDGRMTPCGLMNTPEVFPFDSDFPSAWKELQSLSNSIPVCFQCSQCSYKEVCPTCPARLKNETGFYDKPAPYLCEFAERKKLQAGIG